MKTSNIEFLLKDGRRAVLRNAVESDAQGLYDYLVKSAGNCEISFNGKSKLRHRASLAIALLKDYWGQGIGSKMFETMIKTAEDFGGVTRLFLEVVEGNERALALYRKFGFEIVSHLPDGLRLKDGTYLSEFRMMKKLGE